MSNIKALDKLRKAVKKGKACAFPSGSAYYEAIDECVDAIEREVSELQENWAQEAREHANDSAILAELAHENDELVRETAKRFMRLPVDMDGVPIHVGDLVYIDPKSPTKYEVEAVNEYEVVLDGMFLRPADECRHVKPRTLEDVLYECFHDCMYKYPTGIEDIIVKYADEIRELMGVGE